MSHTPRPQGAGHCHLRAADRDQRLACQAWGCTPAERAEAQDPAGIQEPSGAAGTWACFPSSLHVSRAPTMGPTLEQTRGVMTVKTTGPRPPGTSVRLGRRAERVVAAPRSRQECPLRLHLPEGETEGAPKGSRIPARPLSRSHCPRPRVSGTSGLALPFSDGNTEDHILESLRLSLPEPSQ